MNTARIPILFLAVLLTVLLSACQQQFVGGSSLGLRDYPDAVVHINQVHPAYRAYFAQQHGASYSLSEQRKAFSKARETARTPVRESAYQPAKAAPRKKRYARAKCPLAAGNLRLSDGKRPLAAKSLLQDVAAAADDFLP